MRNLHSFAARVWRRQMMWVVGRFAVSVGANKAFREIGVRWPGGATQILDNVAAFQILEVLDP